MLVDGDEAEVVGLGVGFGALVFAASGAFGRCVGTEELAAEGLLVVAGAFGAEAGAADLTPGGVPVLGIGLVGPLFPNGAADAGLAPLKPVVVVVTAARGLTPRPSCVNARRCCGVKPPPGMPEETMRGGRPGRAVALDGEDVAEVGLGRDDRDGPGVEEDVAPGRNV